MTDNERTRIEIAFDGQQVLSVLVPLQTAEDLDRALAGDHDTSYSFESEDGRYTILLRRVVYVKRFARESRVGFGAAADGAGWAGDVGCCAKAGTARSASTAEVTRTRRVDISVGPLLFPLACAQTFLRAGRRAIAIISSEIVGVPVASPPSD